LPEGETSPRTLKEEMRTYSEDELIPISALQHAMFCERQYALIHIEGLWDENLFTAEGRVLHERVDREHHESRRHRKTEYGMAIRSLRYGLTGKADVVEFERSDHGSYDLIRPVEFKRGRTKENDVDRVQLCAQAICLEEMFEASIDEGQFYYLQEHRRSTVEFSPELRKTTKDIIERVRELFESGETPLAVYEKRKCDRCSLVERCMPRAVNRGGKSVSRYVAGQVRAGLKEDGV
jgi:CRISPR-associated exonuclease Cas4